MAKRLGVATVASPHRKALRAIGATQRQVRRIVIAPEPFTIDNAMMTPTLKLRRHVITGRYRDALERLYGR